MHFRKHKQKLLHPFFFPEQIFPFLLFLTESKTIIAVIHAQFARGPSETRLILLVQNTSILIPLSGQENATVHCLYYAQVSYIYERTAKTFQVRRQVEVPC